MDTVTVRSTSSTSGDIEEETILEETATTRRIFRASLVRKPTEAEYHVKGWIIHQRKSLKGVWEDTADLKLSQLKAGDGIKLELPSDQVTRLMESLDKLKAIATQHGVSFGRTELVVAEKGRAVEVVNEEHGAVIQELIDKNHSIEFWRTLRKAQPDLAIKIAALQLQKERERAVRELEGHLRATDWTEDQWRDFFKANDWIFGYGLSYRFLEPVQTEAYYGGKNATGSGGQRGEFLAASGGEARFTTLVEIKRPDTALFAFGNYRNGVPNFSNELIQGMSQVQINARTWDGQAKTEENRELFEERAIYTIDPEAILVIGHCDMLDSVSKRNAFALLRGNLRRPYIITFDELYARARAMIDLRKS